VVALGGVGKMNAAILRPDCKTMRFKSWLWSRSASSRRFESWSRSRTGLWLRSHSSWWNNR
jgi:hypothetical protein